MAQGRPPPRARRRRARRGGGPHGHVLRHRDEGHARDRNGQAEGRAARRPRCCTCSTCPAGSDVQRMREQLSRMERRLNQLTEEVAELDGTRPVDGTPPTAPRRLRCRRRSTQSTSSPASTGTSSGRCCAPATACATCAGRYRRKVGATPKEVVWKRGKAELWRYRNGHGPVRPAGADRAQPREPQLHPRPAARQQPRRVPDRRGARRLHARLGRAGRARRRQRPRALRRLVPAARHRRRAARDRQRRGDARRLLPRAACSRRSTPPATRTRRCATSS